MIEDVVESSLIPILYIYTSSQHFQWQKEKSYWIKINVSNVVLCFQTHQSYVPVISQITIEWNCHRTSIFWCRLSGTWEGYFLPNVYRLHIRSKLDYGRIYSYLRSLNSIHHSVLVLFILHILTAYMMLLMNPPLVIIDCNSALKILLDYG